MKKIYIIGAIIVLAGGLIAFAWKSLQNNASTTAGKSATKTLEEIAQHASTQDCWMAINGKVYDVTKYVASGMHPGGKVIAQGCGKDATDLFSNRPGGKGPHPDRTSFMLAPMQIGILTQ